MSLFTVFAIAVGLSMDTFAVAVASGFASCNLKLRTTLRMPIFFGAFQAVMFVLGWLGGSSIRGYVSGIDHWIAFGLLAFVGGKMIYESFALKEEEAGLETMTLRTLLMLSIATSIDAFATGLGLSFLGLAIIGPALLIGCTTFIISLAGVLIGCRVGHVFESKIEIAGGLILIGIGLKILYEHLW